MKGIMKKTTASLLSLSMLAALVQLPAQAEASDIYLPEADIEESILLSDVFYLASTTAKLSEGANERYLLRVARGGDAAEEAGVTVKISDMTAKYGRDYSISVLGTDENVENADESVSLMEMMEGEEYSQRELKSEDEFYDIMQGDEELKAQTERAVQDTVDYIEDKSGLRDTAPAYTEGDIASGYEEVTRLYSGEPAYPQKLTSSTDTMQQIQQMANVLTDSVIGADLTLHFDAGESEKYLVIDVNDNDKSDGDRYFYLMLGAPYGSTTNSAASSCALTVADDDAPENAKISFDEDSYMADGDNLQITVTREGAINSMAVVHLTSEAGSAVAGRDFSPVDKELVFPFGITKQTVDIPIRQEYLTERADFTLRLEAVQNSEVSGNEVPVTIEPPSAAIPAEEGDAELMAERSYSIEDIVTGDPIDVSNPSVKGHSSHFDGKSKYDKDHWHFEWVDTWNLFHDWNGTVGVGWNLNNGKGYDYAGVQAEWWRSGKCANMNVGFASNLEWGWNSTTDGDTAYNSRNGFGRQTVNFFTQKNNAKRVCFYNQSRCDDCNRLYVYSIKPIYRPFEIFLKNTNKLEFLNENGTKSQWDGATRVKLSGASNQNNAYVVKYTKPGLNSVSIVQDDTSYATISGAKLIDDSGYKKDINLSGSDISDTKTFTMDRDWIEKNINYISIEKNGSFLNSNTNTYGLKGRMNIEPTFSYKSAKVVVKAPENTNFGYFKISSVNRDVSEDTAFTYHRGDILKLDTVMRDQYKDMYEPTGYKISIKQNESDTHWIKRDVIVPYDDISDNRYLNEGKRLKYGYYEITPLYQLKGNAVTVRVRADEVSKLDANNGFMKAAAVNDIKVDGIDYKEYAVYDNVRNGKIYTVGAALSANAAPDEYITWKEAGNGSIYEGELFYHLAGGSKEDNAITLSVEKGAAANMYETLEGSLLRPAYNISTGEASAFTNSPIRDGIVSVGTEYATTDDKGHFRTPPVRAMYGDGAGNKRYLRYMVTVNGTNALYDAEIKAGKTEKQEIFVTEGSSETVKIDVARQSIGFLNIGTENGSILSNIEVFRDTDHEGEGTSLVVDYTKEDETVDIFARLNVAPSYIKQSLDAETGIITESEAVENVTDVTFVAYDPDTHTAKSSFDAQKQDDGSFWAQMSSKDILPGQEIYIRVTTDRSHGISSKTVRYDEDGNIISNTQDNTTYTGSTDGMTYSDVFTGFTVVQKGAMEIPVKQTLELPMDMNFTTLPLIGTTGINFDFPFVTVGSMKTSTGYRMYLGFNPTSLYDKISGDHATSYMSDSGNYFGDIFSIKHPINTFKEGLSQSFKTAFEGWDNIKDTKDTLAAMGAPTWRMSFVFGVYFDFAMISTTNQQTGNTTSSGCDFTGVGGFIAVSAGFKVAWYTLLPVVFIPAYFGIEINGSVMGFFGAEVDYSKPKITYDKAKNATVDFGNSLSEFHSSVRMAATVQIYVGVGLAGTIGLRGGGTFTAMANWEPDAPYVENDWGLALIFTAGIWVDLFLFSVPLQYTFPMIKFGSFEEYDKLAKNGAKLQGLDGDGTEGARFAVREAFTDESSVWLPEGSEAQLMSAFTQTSQQTIVENGYEHPDTQLIKLSDGSIFMAFLDNDASRGEIDRTILKYAVYKNGSWSSPKQVQNDTTGDFQPSVCEIDDGKVMIAWISTDPAERKDDDKEQTENYLRKLEVYTAVIDPNAAEDAVSGLTQLTDDNRYDYKPACAYDDQTKDRTVYYSKNFDTNATTEEMSNPYGSGSLITYMLYSNEKNKWMFDEYYDEEVASDSDRQELIANWGGQRFIQPRMNELGMQVIPNIADFTVIAYNGIAVYAYTVDVDSNADTIDDRELFIQFYNYSNHKTYVPVRLTNDSPMTADSIPQFARSGNGENANTKLFWYRDNKDIAYVNITELVKVGTNEDGTIKSEYLLSKDEDASDRESKGLEALYSFVSPTNEHQNDASGMADFKPVVDGDNLYVVWTQPLTKEIGEEEYKHCREVYATALVQGGSDEGSSEHDPDTIGYSWSSPYKLTNNEVIASEPAAVVDQSGNLMVVYNTYEQTMNSEDSVFGVGAANKDIMTFSAPKLMASYQVPCGAVDVTGIRLSDKTPRSGDKTEITIDVTNKGLSYANGYTVDVYEYRNGSKGEKITTITSTDRLIPDNTDTYTIEWTVPENAQEMSIYTEAHEAEFENISTFESEKIKNQAVYELSDAYVYQDNSGAFRLNASVKNTGNAAGAADDKVRVTFVGPYAMNLGYSREECLLGDISLDSIPVYTETETDEGLSVTGQSTIDGDLVIPEGALEKYGYIDCIAQAFDKDGNELGQGTDVRIVAQKPTGLMLNGDEIPEEITLGPGESIDLKVTGTPALLNESIDMTFVTDDTSVAFVNGDTLTANAPGETVLHGVVCPYSMELQDIRVKVLESTVEGIEVTYDKTSGEARLESSEAIENADLIFAEYDSDGKLLSAEVRTVTAAAKGAARTSYTVKSADNTLKVMLWDRVNGLKPYDFKYIEEVN